MSQLVLVAAIVLWRQDDMVLLAKRPEGKAMAGLWEFPGGKLEPNETPETALCRECWEELGIEIGTSDLVPLTFASHSYDAFHLLMPVYSCRTWGGTPRALEHAELAWVNITHLSTYPMPAADLPLVHYLQRHPPA